MANQPIYEFPSKEVSPSDIVDIIASGLEGSITQALGEPDKTFKRGIKFLGKTGLLSTAVLEGYDLFFNPEGKKGFVDVLNTATGLITTYSLSSSAEIVLGLTSAVTLGNVIAVGLIAGGVTFLYNRSLSEPVDLFFDELLGTLDVKLEVFSSNGKQLGDVIYPNGLNSRQYISQAIRDLVSFGDTKDEIPDFQSGDFIRLYRKGSDQPVDNYTFYEGKPLSNLAEEPSFDISPSGILFLGSNREYLVSQSSNDLVEEENRTLFAMSADEQLIIPDPINPGFKKFRPDQILFSDDNGVTKKLSGDVFDSSSEDLSSTFDDKLIIGNSGNDSFLDFYGGNDIIVGGAGIDDIQGFRGNDILLGGSDDDILTGSYTTQIAEDFEQDILIGGAGADLFVLGNTDRRFYSNGGANGTEVNPQGSFALPKDWTPQDFAIILDSNPEEGDKVQLKGPEFINLEGQEFSPYRVIGLLNRNFLAQISDESVKQKLSQQLIPDMYSSMIVYSSGYNDTVADFREDDVVAIFPGNSEDYFSGGGSFPELVFI